MFDGLNYITLFWLSGFGEPKYEIWEGKKASILRTPDSLSFKLYLAWLLEEAEEGQIMIRQTSGGLTLETGWFPEEEFNLKDFPSQDGNELLLMGSFQREYIFIHFHKP